MDTNLFEKGLLITAIPFFIAASCNKNDTRPCANGGYAFTVTSEWSPQREVYNIGDTIFLNSTFSKNLTDLIGNSNINYSNSVGISGNITTSFMDTVTHRIIDAFLSFEVVPIKGSVAPINNVPNAGVSITFLEESNYNFKAGFVLKQKGLFQLAVTNLASQGIRRENCTNAGFNMTVTNSNKNINLFEYALRYIPDALLQKSIYCFRVQ